MRLEPASVRPSVHTIRHEYRLDQPPDHDQISSRTSFGWGIGCIIASIELLWGKSCEHSNSSIFHLIFFVLAGNMDSNKSLDGFDIRQDWTGSAELATIERLKNLARLITGEML